MKNCLIVLLVLGGCFAVAGCLVLFPPGRSNGSGPPPGTPYMIAQWRNFNEGSLQGVEITVGTDRIDVDVPAVPQYHRTETKGRWSGHTFYCDSHLDAPAEIAVARELPNEDLEVDAGHFFPDHPGKITLVKTSRCIDGERPPYPIVVPGQTVTYPPPKGLIKVGMLQCDLDTLPWNPGPIEIQPTVVHADTTQLSDGSGRFYVPQNIQPNEQTSPELYTYHSDRPGIPSLLVTVNNGRVVEVRGGAEESDDPPWHLPPRPPPADDPAATPDASPRTWSEWLWDYLFTK